MRPRSDGAGRRDRRDLRLLREGRHTASDFAGPQRPAPHLAKDFLGAAVTLAIIGALVLQVTNRLASPCWAQLNPRRAAGACSGLSAIAQHAHRIVDLSVIACAAVAVVAFIWYMFWGYKINAPVGGNRDSQDL